jgi:predicted enzyme related to lactoylglutathione lyase
VSSGLGFELTIFTADVDAARKFYSERFGCAIEEVAADSLIAERDGLRLRIEGGARPRKRGRKWMEEAGVLVTLLPKNFDAFAKELQGKGIELLGGITTDPDGRRYAGFADPDGNLFEITER